MGESKLDLLQGTLDVMVLQTLAAMGSLHGYGIARRIEQVSGNQVLLNQGTIYASLVRLQQRGWIAAEWGPRTIIAKPSSTALRGSDGNSLRNIPPTGSGWLE
jgi:DNA-binding PadR family transcriptional regulator